VRDGARVRGASGAVKARKRECGEARGRKRGSESEAVRVRKSEGSEGDGNGGSESGAATVGPRAVAGAAWRFGIQWGVLDLDKNL